MCNTFLVIVLVTAVSVGYAAKGLPSYLKLCDRKDPNLKKCVEENVEILRPKFRDGIPELFVPSLNPLVIPEATLNSGDNFKASFRDIQIYHFEDFKLQDVEMDLDKYYINLDILFPSLRIKSTYNINGRILVLNLDGKGPADGNYTNVHGSLKLKGTPFQKNNKEFIKWEKETINIEIERIHLFFDRLFGDNADLNAQTNKVINENIDTIFVELRPVVQQVVNDFIFGIVNRLFSRYSISELFPSSQR